jgi:hypothetical protein
MRTYIEDAHVFSRLNSVTGWCGQQEAFTYVSVDLGTLHRVKAILVKVGCRLGVGGKQYMNK